MPNPLREKSNGRLVLTVPLIIFMDDVSGNVSKQWNKHHAVYMSNASMPCEMLEKEFCIRFVSSSLHASPMEIIKGVKESIRFVCFNFLSQFVMLMCPSGLLRMRALLHTTANIKMRLCLSLMAYLKQEITPCKRKSVAMAVYTAITSVAHAK
jgi:hypothetical protein